MAEIGNPPQKEQCKFLLKICRQISTSSLGLNNGAWGRERADAMGEGGFEGHKPSPLLGQWSGGWPWGWGCPPLARWQVGSETKRNQFARLDQTYCDEPEWPGVTPDWWVDDFCNWLKVWTFQPYISDLGLDNLVEHAQDDLLTWFVMNLYELTWASKNPQKLLGWNSLES